MKVLFNADDFGLTDGVTDGIMQAHVDGIVGATTLMMNGRAANYAVAQAKKYPSLKVGIHLVLTWGMPISEKVPDLLDHTGRFKYNSGFAEMPEPNIAQVEKEWRAQLDAFLKTGLPLHHIDSHHHVHGWAPLKDVILRLARDYNVPVRYVDSLKDNPEICLTETLFPDFYGEGVRDDVFKRLLQMNAASIEVMTHPAIVDDTLREVSSYTDKRKEELRLLTSLSIPDVVELM